MNPDLHLSSIRTDTDRMARAVRTGDLGAPVAACPGWDLRQLVVHTGAMHRWATAAIIGGAAPEAVEGALPAPDASADDLAGWLVDGVGALTGALGAGDPEAPTWHPFGLPQQMWVWARRQAHETMIHRWDAEVAAFGASSLDTAMAVDGIAEFFDLVLPRVFVRESPPVPSPSLHVHCTDDDPGEGAGEWIAWNDGGDYRFALEHRTGDAAMRGTAADLLLVLMGRAARSTVDVVGDAAAADAWLDLPGL